MRLIDAEELLDEYEAYGNTSPIALTFIDDLKEAPTVEERKHGRWEEDEDKDIYCTNCKHFLYPAEIRMQQITLSSRRLKRKFCPECGAIMNEATNNDN